MRVAEGELVGVRLQVLRGDVVESPVKRPLHLRPEAFNGVGVDFATGVFFFPVIDCPVSVAEIPHVPIAQEFIGHNLRAFRDVGTKQRLNGSPFDVRNDLNLDPAFSLNLAKDRRLAFRAASTLSWPLAAKIAFVHFHGAGQRIAAILHQLSNPLRNAPSALIGHAKLAFKLFSRDPVLRLAHQENSVEPGNQGCWALVKNGSFRGIDLIAARASVRATAFNGIKVLLMAFGALKAIGIAALEDMCQASLIIGEVFSEVLDCVFHANSIAGMLLVVKG